MSTFLLVQVDDSGTPSVVALTDPVTVTESVSIPLSALFPETQPGAAPPPPATEQPSTSDAQPPTA